MTGQLHVHHLNCAHITRMSLSGHPLACHVLLVETPVDGLGTQDYADISRRLGKGFAYGYARPAIDPSLAALKQVRALGFDPRDVAHIVQTHLDLDHVGGLADFPWAAVHVHATEHDAAMARRGVKARSRYGPLMWAHHPRWETYTDHGESWHGFDTVRQLRGLPAEILFVALPGHTLGHCGVALDTSTGWLLDAGDAYFDPREVHQPVRRCAPGVALFQTIVTTDRQLRQHSQDRLRTLIREHPDITVFAAHDPGALPTVATERPTLAEDPPTLLPKSMSHPPHRSAD